MLTKDKTNFMKVYQKHLGKKVYFVFLFTILATLMENFGILMALPLLNLAIAGYSVASDSNYAVLFLKNILDQIGLPLVLETTIILIITLFFIKGICIFISQYLVHIFRSKLSQIMRYSLIDAYNKIKMGHFYNKNSGDFLNAITDQTTKAVDTFLYFSKVVSGFMQAFVATAFALLVAPRSTFLAVVAAMILMFLFKILNTYVRNLSKLLTNENSKFSAIMIQYFAAFKYLRATNHSSDLIILGKSSIANHSSILRRTGIASAFTGSIKDPTAVILIMLVIYSEIVVHGGEIAPILISVVFLYKAWSSIIQLQMSWQQCLEGSGAVQFIADELSQANLYMEADNGLIEVEFEREFEFKNLSFQYNQSTTAGLNNINLIIKKNSLIALVGHSGSGKTTIIDIIAMLHEPTSGEMLVDNVSTHTISKLAWRKNIGYVSQHPFILNASVINNITFGAKATNDKITETELLRVKEVCMLADIHGLIEGLPQKYDTVLSEGGTNISGGQRQRIAIARELFKSPDILIFDEATSALDKRSEQEILNTIQKLRNSITIIFVTHRLASVTSADYIYVLENGKILESGSYSQLASKRNGYFTDTLQIEKVKSKK